MQRRPDPADGGGHGLQAAHVEHGVLLAGEARVRQVFGGRAGADRHGAIAQRGQGRRQCVQVEDAVAVGGRGDAEAFRNWEARAHEAGQARRFAADVREPGRSDIT